MAEELIQADNISPVEEYANKLEEGYNITVSIAVGNDLMANSALKDQDKYVPVGKIAFMPYCIGKIANAKVYIDPTRKFDDMKIYKFPETDYVDYESVNEFIEKKGFEYTDEMSMADVIDTIKEKWNVEISVGTDSYDDISEQWGIDVKGMVITAAAKEYMRLLFDNMIKTYN